MTADTIDLELGKKVVGGNEQIARDMLAELNKLLPEHENILKKAYEGNNLDALLAETHKLRGGTCYCGTPALKEAASALETALNHNESNIEGLYKHLMAEIEIFKQAYKTL